MLIFKEKNKKTNNQTIVSHVQSCSDPQVHLKKKKKIIFDIFVTYYFADDNVDHLSIFISFHFIFSRQAYTALKQINLLVKITAPGADIYSKSEAPLFTP